MILIVVGKLKTRAETNKSRLDVQVTETVVESELKSSDAIICEVMLLGNN